MVKYRISSAGRKGNLSDKNRILHDVVSLKKRALIVKRIAIKDGFKNVRISK